MTTPNNDPREERVLVLMPTGRDAVLVCGALKERGIPAHACSDINELSQGIESEAGAVLIAEEALKEASFRHLMGALNRQPVWSDLPVIFFATGDRSVEVLLEELGTRLNATIVERPIRRTILISAVQGALRARRRQYQARDLLAQLKETDRQKDLFLATVSHELRTPLNSMLGWIQLLQDGRLPTTEYAHALEVLERNAKSQADLVSDILFLSRVVTGKLTLDNRLLDLNLVIEGAIDTVRPSMEAKGLRLETSVDSDTGPIVGDPDRLQQVICNLLSNAVKFTPEGGSIDVHLERQGAFAEIIVRDTGQGISPEFLPYVFERFRQADSSSTRAFGGLGLGLAIVRHIVELHGGTVRTESEGLGMGSAFFVRLPIAANQSLDVPAEKTPERSAAKAILPADVVGLQVLLVEDDRDSREMLATAFKQSGIQVTAVASAAEAMEAIRKSKPDVLVSDIGMPNEDGYDLIRKIRALSPDQGGTVPAIALTGYASVQDQAKTSIAGYQEHIAKPVAPGEVLKVITLLAKGTASS